MESTSKANRMVIRYPGVLQLYSVGTPNGIKVHACLEELAFLKGESNFTYEPHTVDIRHGESRTPEFAEISPNQKIPVLVDPTGPGGHTDPVKVFESGAILLYLAEKYDELLPHEAAERVEVKKWLFWGSSAVSNQVKLFGFYYKYCPHSLPYCVERYTKEVKRLLAVLERQLQHQKHWITGDMYTIADVSVWPWIFALHENYDNAALVRQASINSSRL